VTDVRWTHPSVRDLVIEYVQGNAAERQHFLRSCSRQGLMLALSGGGGSTGDRTLPFIKSDADWQCVSERLKALLAVATGEARADLASTIADLAHRAVAARDVSSPLAELVRDCLPVLAERWASESAAIPNSELRDFFRASCLTDPPTSPPPLMPTWVAFTEALEECAKAEALTEDALLRLRARVALPRLLQEFEPRFLAYAAYPDCVKSLVSSILEKAYEFGEALDELDRDEEDGDECPVEPSADERHELEILEVLSPLLPWLLDIHSPEHLDPGALSFVLSEHLSDRRHRQYRYWDWESEQEAMEEDDYGDEDQYEDGDEDRSPSIEDVFADLV